MSNESPPAAGMQPSPGASVPGSFDTETPRLAGCTGVAQVGICIRCDRLYIGGPQIAPLAKRESGVYRCVEFATNGQRLAENKESV